MLGLELVDFQFEGDQAVERPVEEEQVEGEIPPADLERVLAADEAEVAAQFDQELLELLDQGRAASRPRNAWAEGRGTRRDSILEDRGGVGVQFSSAVVTVLPATGRRARRGHR